MPWALNMVVMLAIASSPFQWYAFRRISGSISTLTSWRRRPTRMATSAIVFYPVSYPLVAAISYAIGEPQVYQRGSLLVDALLTYPFWIGVVFAVQLALLLIVVDVARLALYPAYRKNK